MTWLWILLIVLYLLVGVGVFGAVARSMPDTNENGPGCAVLTIVGWPILLAFLFGWSMAQSSGKKR